MKKLLILPIFLGSLALVGCQKPNISIDPLDVATGETITGAENMETTVPVEDIVDLNTQSDTTSDVIIDDSNFKNIDYTPYTTDGKKIYYGGKLVPEADLNTFHAYEKWGRHIGEDKDHIYVGTVQLQGITPENVEFSACRYIKGPEVVYYADILMSDADAATFEIIPDGTYMENCGWYSVYGKDKNHIYFNNEILDKADLNSFEIISHSDRDTYARDKSFVYLNGKILLGANPEHFRHINYDYFQDDIHVFYMGNVITGVDLDTFQIKNSVISQDKNHTYEFGEIVE